MAMMNTGVEEAEISSFEKDCIKKLDEQPDFEEELSSGKDDASHRLWHSFQDSATAVSKFYLGKSTVFYWCVFSVGFYFTIKYLFFKQLLQTKHELFRSRYTEPCSTRLRVA
jgi:hypothetical protein